MEYVERLLLVKLRLEIMNVHIQENVHISVNFVEQHSVKEVTCKVIKGQLIMMIKDINVKPVAKDLRDEGTTFS